MAKNSMTVYVVGVEGKGYFAHDGEIYPDILQAKLFEVYQEAYEIAEDWLGNETCNISKLKLTYQGWTNSENGNNELI
jgi:hypothetical protein